MIIQGIEELEKNLKNLAKATQSEDVIVGYSADYAVYVHETNKNYNNNKQWKYLETPARRLRSLLLVYIIQTYKRTKDFQKSLIAAGMKLQAASMDIVPVDTGALKASAFTSVESKAPAVATRAKRRNPRICKEI